jgi:hypothetical protein
LQKINDFAEVTKLHELTEIQKLWKLNDFIILLQNEMTRKYSQACSTRSFLLVITRDEMYYCIRFENGTIIDAVKMQNSFDLEN